MTSGPEDHESTIASLEARLRSNPDDWTAMSALGNALIVAGRGTEAVPYVIAVCDMFARDGFFKHARELLKRAECVDPANPAVRTRLDLWAEK